MRRTSLVLIAFLAGALGGSTAYAAEIGHFAPGVGNIRDFAVPDAGFYGALYNYGYSTTRLNDADGQKLSSVTIGGPGNTSATLGVDIDVNLYALAPTIMWVAKKTVLGTKFGAFIIPTFSNASLDGLLSIASGQGQKVGTGQFNVGDTFVQPVWLGWTGKHTDVSYGYGFYIPSGKYKITSVTLPVVGAVSAEAPDNTGLGFWTNQNQGAFYIYPWADKRLAIENALTWEVHRKKRNVALTPGQDLSWNWGLSQYLPLKKDMSMLLEAGPAGYLSYQVTDDTGAAVKDPGLHDHVSAAGLQAGITFPKRGVVLNFHWFHEYSAVDRFQGSSIGLNLVVKLSKD